MSRKVIHDLVLPVVLKRLQGMGIHYSTYDRIEDRQLEDFFDEELSRVFGICGKEGHCEQLEQMIRESKELDPEGFERMIARLLEKYINLKTALTEALIEKKKHKKLKGPPDRFQEQREKAKKVWRVM